jgi:hypothetical protein
MKKSELKEYIKASLSENTTLTKDTIHKKYNEMFGKNPQTTFADVAKALGTTEQAIAMALMGGSLPMEEDMSADRAATDAKKKAIDAEIKALQAKKAELSRPTTPSPLAEEDEENGIDTSMDKVSKALTAAQKQLDQMFADFKSGKYTKDEYMDKRKTLQAKRDKLNAALISFEEDENKL